MESIYYVVSWACHRKCTHCYEPRFRPYARSRLRALVDETKTIVPQVIANLPERMDYLDLSAPSESAPGGYEPRPGRIILAGGEVLIDPVREEVLYPALEAIAARYTGQGVRVVVQTTGDLVTPAVIDELLTRGVWMISCAGMDDFHVGMEGDKRLPLIEHLRQMFEAANMTDSAGRADERNWAEAGESGPVYSLFGATEDAWIGKIWPRGRAWEHSLSRATIEDNFCNAWSGGLNFLRRGFSGSEVSIDPNGDVFPCCLKTKKALGNLTEEPLDTILASLEGHPAFEAISNGHPERMGITYGWDVARFLEACRTTTPDGRPYRNLCIGCDRFHEEVLGPVIDRIRAERLAARGATT
ncbi:MAG: SPASM domain-containing protein [Vicinamibacteraceae bacterium]